MKCVDIRGQLTKIFSFKTSKLQDRLRGPRCLRLNHCLQALLGASVQQIVSDISLSVVHPVPFRVISAEEQLADSKGASGAISTVAVVLSTRRAMRRFMGPKVNFRSPKAIFRFVKPSTGMDESQDNIDITLGNKVRKEFRRRLHASPLCFWLDGRQFF